MNDEKNAGANPHEKNKSGINAIELADMIDNYDVKQFLEVD